MPQIGYSETRLTPEEEAQFQAWKQQYAPRDSGYDYDLRGAFKAGLTPDPQTGHWPDTYKKPGHPTFSNESQYATGINAGIAGQWTGPQHDVYQSAGTGDDIRLEQVKKLRGHAVAQSDVTPPSQAMVRPDLSAYTQASQLEAQAAPPPDPTQGMSLAKAMLYRGLQGAAGGAIHAQEQGGYTGYLDRQTQLEHQREQDLLARAKGLRAEGYQRERDFATDQQARSAFEQRQQQATAEQDYRTAQLSSEDAYRKAQIEKLRQPPPGEFSFERGTPGQPYGSFNRATGRFEQLGMEPVLPKEVPPINPEVERHNRAMEAAALLRAQKTGAGGASDPEPGGYQAERAGRIVDSVNELKKLVSPTTVGVGTDLLSKIPIAGQAAANFRAQLETLKSNIITNELQQMRADSKTGGALGQVSDRESAFLSSALGSLATIQDPAAFNGQLDKIVESVQRWQKAKGIPVGGNRPTSGGQKLKRTNNRTGEVQFSDDGGKTWRK